MFFQRGLYRRYQLANTVCHAYHLVHVAAFPDEAPFLGDPPARDAQIGGPVRQLGRATENDHDGLVVGRYEGLGVLDGIEQ